MTQMMSNTSPYITNQGELLYDVINNILPKSKAIDILVGYFFFSGFEQLDLKDKPTRILVGLEVDSTVNNRIREINTFQQSGVKARQQIKDEYYASLSKLFNETDTFDSDDQLKSFEVFYQKIKDGSLQIRKTEEPCHAKLYIFDYNDQVNEGGAEPGTVITGSSNLSYQGLGGRTEINVRNTGKAPHHHAKEIFNELWDNSVNVVDESSIPDFEEKVIKNIWYEKIYSPYLMYVRVLHEYFSIPTKENILTPHDITGGKFYNLKYQTDATQMALNALDNHNGVIIADVVGLGKSIIASTVARNLNLNMIIVCPPHLTQQWDEYSVEFGFKSTVFSSGQLENALQFYKRTRKNGEEYLIVIDEAHKYRNEYTQDYSFLHDLCMGNKVVLLTATPFNNKPDDIYSMIKLFQIPTKSTLRTVDNLGVEFKALIQKYKQLRKNQKEGNISEDDIKQEAAKISAKIRSIISPLVIRRSRLDLMEIPEYKEDLKRQNIEVVLPNDPVLLEYDLDGIQDLYLRTLDKIAPEVDNGHAIFLGARYQPIQYVLDDKLELLKKELEDDTGIEYGLLVGSQGNLSKFMKRLLVRRFESSVFAFEQTLSNMIKSYEHLVKWVDVSKKIPIFKKGSLPDVEDFYGTSNDREEADLLDIYEKYKEKGFFEIKLEYLDESYMKCVQQDLCLLRDIYQEWFGGRGEISQDPKLDSFITLLQEQQQKDPSRKIIVFTEFADTADYLGKQLQNKLDVFKYTSSDASVKNKEIIRANFDAGLPEDYQRDDFQILIATDAISEGYNLHRAGAIFNYDIPYNPTRVIQRIGRINRVNKRVFDKLYIYNYFPSSVGESETRTKEISTLKMAMIHAIMGEDTKALTNEEELKSYFSEIYQKELSVEEAASWDNKYRTLLNQLKGTEVYEKALAIQHRSRVARQINSDDKGVLLFGKKGNDYVFKMGTAKESHSLTAEQALKLFEAEISEEPIETSEGFDANYQYVKSTLFNSKASDDSKEKERLKAMDKTKLILNSGTVAKDYITDLIRVIKSDGLSGFELRYINKLKKVTYRELPQNIEHEYLTRIIATMNQVEEGDEVLILSEEFL